jgi:hypothetical protein
LLDVARDIDAGLSSLRDEGCQRIKVVASQTIAEYLMPHWLLSLRAANAQQTGSFPEENLTTTNSEHAIAVVRGGAPPISASSKISAPLRDWELAQTPLVCREPRASIRSVLPASRGADEGSIRRQNQQRISGSQTRAMTFAVWP